MSNVARAIYDQYPFDGKYILDGDRLIICQSNVNSETIRFQYPGAIVNPLLYLKITVRTPGSPGLWKLHPLCPVSTARAATTSLLL